MHVTYGSSVEYFSDPFLLLLKFILFPYLQDYFNVVGNYKDVSFVAEHPIVIYSLDIDQLQIFAVTADHYKKKLNLTEADRSIMLWTLIFERHIISI